MDYKNILDSWIGKTIDYDGAFKFQCTDFSRQFAKDTGNPINGFSGSALKGFTTGSPLTDKWEKVIYEKGKVPKLGDIFFLDKTSKNPYGHTGVVYEGSTPDTMNVVEQNAGTGNGDGKGGNAITKRSYGYNTSRGRVLGWFTLKSNNQTPTMPPTESPFKSVYEKEAKDYFLQTKKHYGPTYSGFDDMRVATIADIKYLIEINNIRNNF